MKVSDMEKGMSITIADDVSHTVNTHSVNNDMRYMIGKKYRIQSVIDTTHGKAGVVGGFYWHPEDLIEIPVPEKEPQIFHFDIERLDIN